MLHLANPRALWWILLFAIALHLPAFWSNHFFADDLMQHFVLRGNALLEQQGFAGEGEVASLAYVIKNQFHFFNPNHPAYSALKNSGALPWWLPDDAQIHFWRPLSSFSHWLDYQLWPESFQLMHAHSAVLLILFWFLAAIVYRTAMPSVIVTNVAILLLVLDISILFPLDWLAARNSVLLLVLAPIFILSLYQSSKWHYWPVLMLYGLGLLIAEAGVALLGFVLAWLVFMDTRPLIKRIAVLLAFIVLTLCWRAYYQSQGYGAYGVSHYIDPLYSPWAFLRHAFWHYPVLLTHMITGLEGTDFYIHGAGRYVQAAIGYVLLVLPPLAAWKLNIATRAWWFWYAAALCSLQPYTALALSDPRISTLSFMAYVGALAPIIAHYFFAAEKKLWLKIFVSLSLLSHVVLSVTALLIWCVTPAVNSDQQDARLNHFAQMAEADKPIVIANSVDPFRHFYYPYRSAFLGVDVAPSVRALMLAQTAVTVERLTDTEYRLSQQGAMWLTPSEIYQAQHRAVSGVEGMSWLLMGFFHNGDYRFSEGQHFVYPELGIIIEALDQGRPSQIRVTLASTDVRWLYWDWHSRQYLPMAQLAVGDTLILQGKYENTQ